MLIDLINNKSVLKILPFSSSEIKSRLLYFNVFNINAFGGTVVNMRWNQNLLQHESTKTTEIYTLIRNKSLAKIKSPIDYIFACKIKHNSKLYD